ncbi:hypothetical protein [Streptomyces axinellae]|uniref:Uncharacterized protein n=1 Tax=Streptomyces axinellae TaxID=552788 RepID=A0ABN3QN73_9ACTN
MYKLRHYDETVTAIWDSLPAAAREELTLALFEIIEDPHRHTRPINGQDHDVERTLTLQHTAITLLIIDAPPIQRVYIRSIEHLD